MRLTRFIGPVLACTMFCSSSLASAATNPASQHLDNLVGTWHCTYHSGGETRTTVSVGTRLNDNWVQLKGVSGTTLVTYDAKRKQWLQFAALAEGNYGLSTASESPVAKSLVWRGQYPPDMRNDTATITWPDSSTREITATFMRAGKAMRSQGECRKK